MQGETCRGRGGQTYTAATSAHRMASSMAGRMQNASLLHSCIPAYRHTVLWDNRHSSDNRNMLQQHNARKYETETQSRLRSASAEPVILCAAWCLLQHISTSVQLVGRGTTLSMVNRSRCATLTRRLEAHSLLSCLFVCLLTPNENHQTQHDTDR